MSFTVLLVCEAERNFKSGFPPFSNQHSQLLPSSLFCVPWTPFGNLVKLMDSECF